MIFKMIYYNGRDWKESRVEREREERERNIPCMVVQGLWSNFGATF